MHVEGAGRKVTFFFKVRRATGITRKFCWTLNYQITAILHVNWKTATNVDYILQQVLILALSKSILWIFFQTRNFLLEKIFPKVQISIDGSNMFNYLKWGLPHTVGIRMPWWSFPWQQGGFYIKLDESWRKTMPKSDVFTDSTLISGVSPGTSGKECSCCSVRFSN